MEISGRICSGAHAYASAAISAPPNAGAGAPSADISALTASAKSSKKLNLDQLNFMLNYRLTDLEKFTEILREIQCQQRAYPIVDPYIKMSRRVSQSRAETIYSSMSIEKLSAMLSGGSQILLGPIIYVLRIDDVRIIQANIAQQIEKNLFLGAQGATYFVKGGSYSTDKRYSEDTRIAKLFESKFLTDLPKQFDFNIHLAGANFSHCSDSSKPGESVENMLLTIAVENPIDEDSEENFMKGVSGEGYCKAYPLSWFKYTNQVIQDRLDRNEKVLISSFGGMNRSSAVMIAYLINKYKRTEMPLANIYDFIQRKRPCAKPNQYLRMVLEVYYYRCNFRSSC